MAYGLSHRLSIGLGGQQAGIDRGRWNRERISTKTPLQIKPGCSVRNPRWIGGRRTASWQAAGRSCQGIGWREGARSLEGWRIRR